MHCINSVNIIVYLFMWKIINEDNMTTTELGNLGELKVIEKCLQNGISVFQPFGDGNRIDLVLVVNGKCLRAQVKTSTVEQEGRIIFKTSSTKRNGSLQKYTKDDIDIFLLYTPIYDEIYCIRVEEVFKTEIYFRRDEPKKWSATMHLTKDYPFEKIFDYSKL